MHRVRPHEVGNQLLDANLVAAVDGFLRRQAQGLADLPDEPLIRAPLDRADGRVEEPRAGAGNANDDHRHQADGLGLKSNAGLSRIPRHVQASQTPAQAGRRHRCLRRPTPGHETLIVQPDPLLW